MRAEEREAQGRPACHDWQWTAPLLAVSTVGRCPQAWRPASGGVRIPVWASIAAGVLVVLSVLFFFQTKDPMILLFGVVAAAMLVLVAVAIAFLAALAPRLSGGGVQVRCRACGALSPAASRYCGACGKEL